MISFTITNKHRPKATIIMLVSLYGKQYRKSIGVGVPAKYWNATKHRAKVTADFREGNVINDEIERWSEIGAKVVKRFREQKISPTSEEFMRAVEEIAGTPVYAETRTEAYFCDYFESVYITRYRSVRDSRTIDKYNTALNKLRAYERDKHRKLRFEDINIDFYNDFQHWFYQKGLSANYFGTVIKNLKQVYRESKSYDHLHDSNGTEHRDFVASQEPADTVYLNNDELTRIYELDIPRAVAADSGNVPLSSDNTAKKVAALERAKGLFLIGCYTGLRVSDFSRLRDAHIGQYITIKTHKTGVPVIIPIHPVVRTLLDRGFDLTDTVSDQKLNGHIKELCRLAGITEEIVVNKNVGGENVETVVPKYKLVSSHTARRSFATNAYKAGVPTIAIMKITGHTKESTFLKYIRISAEENAEMLSNHPFFKSAADELQ